MSAALAEITDRARTTILWRAGPSAMVQIAACELRHLVEAADRERVAPALAEALSNALAEIAALRAALGRANTTIRSAAEMIGAERRQRQAAEIQGHRTWAFAEAKVKAAEAARDALAGRIREARKLLGRP